MKSLLSVCLMLLAPLPALAPTCPFPPLPQPADSSQEDGVEPSGSAERASASPQGGPEEEQPPWVDPKLVNKKVVVHLHDGQVYKGKLIELSADSLTVKTKRGLEKLLLTEVAAVDRQPGNRWKKLLIIFAVAVGVWTVVGLVLTRDR